MAALIVCGTNWGPNNTMYWGTSYPTATTEGTYEVGDVIINTAPSTSGVFMWVCTVRGAPGTWAAVSNGANL